MTRAEKLAEAFVENARERNAPMRAIAATPRYYLAQRYGHRFLSLPIESQREVEAAVSALLGHKPDPSLPLGYHI